MGYMSKKMRTLSEDEVDELVIAHADDDSAWEKPVRVRRSKSSAVSLRVKLASRAALRFRKKHSSLS
jgi:hypothetical protein